MDKQIKALLKEYHPNQPEFHQAVEEIYKDIADFYHDHQTYRDFKILEQLLEPDRVIRFRVCWENDKHEICVNRGWRVQYHNILGPYKGGLRFTPNLNESVLKFLGFEQCFKNALTNFPIGGGKGGADFNPKGKSNHEIRRFCWAFIEELRKYIDRDVDIPAGDIGVGAREIGYMFGHILELDNKYTGVLTGKGIQFGGSCGREHATGYGCIYFLKEMLKAHDHEFKHKKIVISGAGNVALHVAEKSIFEQAKVLTLSDREGFVYFKQGLSFEQLEDIKKLKFKQYGSLKQWAADKSNVEFYEDKKPWTIPCDIAIPCATQNEMDDKSLKQLLDNDVLAVCEGANMPLTAAAQSLVQDAGVLYGPGKAANAGGVAVSVLEQLQNLEHITWPLERVDQELQQIMISIHKRCLEYLTKERSVYDYKKGANLWSFKRLADALMAYGIK